MSTHVALKVNWYVSHFDYVGLCLLKGHKDLQCYVHAHYHQFTSHTVAMSLYHIKGAGIAKRKTWGEERLACCKLSKHGFIFTAGTSTTPRTVCKVQHEAKCIGCRGVQ